MAYRILIENSETGVLTDKEVAGFILIEVQRAGEDTEEPGCPLPTFHARGVNSFELAGIMRWAYDHANGELHGGCDEAEPLTDQN